MLLFIGIPGFRQRDKYRLLFEKNKSFLVNQFDKNNTTYELHSQARETLYTLVHMGCTIGELALSDELHPSLKP